MKKLFQLLLVIIIPLFISVGSVYFHHSGFAKAPLASTNISFENAFQDDLLIPQEKETGGFLTSFLVTPLLPETGYIDQISTLSFISAPPHDQDTFVSRC